MVQALETFRDAAANAVVQLAEPGFYEVAEVSPPAAALLLAHAFVVTGRTLCVVTPGARRAEELTSDLRVVLGEEDEGSLGGRVHAYPAWDILPYEEALPDREVVGERMAALAALPSDEPCIVVASASSALQKTLPAGHAALRGLAVTEGQTWERDELVGALLAAGYRRADVVEEVGECAVRGGIVDAFPPLADLPVRVELDGEVVSSLRSFDPSSQRSVGPLGSVHIWAVREDGLAGPMPRAAAERLRRWALELGVARSRAKELAERLEAGQPAEGAAFLAPLLAGEAASLFDHLPVSARVCLYEPAELTEEAEHLWARAEEGWGLAREARRLASPPAELYLTQEELLRAADRRAGLALSNLPPEKGEAGTSPLRSAQPETFFGRLEAFGQWAFGREGEGERVGVVCLNEASASRLQAVLSEHGLAAPVVEPFVAGGASPLEALEGLPALSILVGRLSAGLSLPGAGVHLVTEEDLFGVRKVARRRRLRRAEAVGVRAAELSPGDYVVHADYGIGRYRGLEAVPVQGEPTECLALEYADGDRVYVPLEQFHLVERYVGADGEPTLAKLGTAAWERTKRRVKAAARELAQELLSVAAEREAADGITFSAEETWHREFAAAFPYEETEDQARVIEEVAYDMESSRPMDRLVCGDVGYGKTEVAMRAAFKAVFDGRQVAVLVPTTVLAAQHYQTFSARFAAYPVNIAMLSRFLPRSRQAAVVEGLAAGDVDLVIGTHRLLQEDVAFA
ncbi:MAG: CarD family transcriptional regulator, partial [Nitrospinota bacterium]